LISDPMHLLRKGKVKDVFELGNGNLIFIFSDRISAFDVRFEQKIPNKGKVLCKFADYWFKQLKIPNHSIRMRRNNVMEVRKLRMIPYEFIVRGYYYGSMVERYSSNKDLKSLFGINFPLKKGSRLPYPFFEITTKSETHDVPIKKDLVLDSNAMSRDNIEEIETKSLLIYDRMNSIAEQSGFIIADVKLEYGFDEENEIYLADSIGPDEFRIWLQKDYQPGKTQESFDKQLLRDWLIEIGFKTELDRMAEKGKVPGIPEIPNDLIQKISARYVYAYEKITGQRI
jgi:phosphoribosylaminoimidazole-succinocarboxamide synthase